MSKNNDYKKQTTKECHYCDYCFCRKGYKCSWYKKLVKKFKKIGQNKLNANGEF